MHTLYVEGFALLNAFINTAEKGKIFSWGDGKKGQLGHGAKELTIQYSPKHSKIGVH